MTDHNAISWINATSIIQTLTEAKGSDKHQTRSILQKASEKKGLNALEVAHLMAVEDADLLSEMFALAKKVKEEIYGRRIVLFSPMYISNHCKNECLYCAFRASNQELKRRALNMEDIARETRILVDQGHKRTLLVAGESYSDHGGFDYVLRAMETIYAVQGNKPGANIRRINVNIAPLGINGFKKLEAAKVGTYQLFQETYDRTIYRQLHPSGRKADFDWRATAMHRAMEAGLGDVGIGVLFGLADWRFETLALLQHINELERTFGVGCHTISVPRLEPAHGAPFASAAPNAVNDEDFKKIIAILRLAVPYTGLIMSTRETAQMRQETLELGISQISAGSRTNPGGYAETGEADTFDESQFQLGDHRSLDEVVRDLAERGFIPSNCTACDQLGRMGTTFMAFAQSGKIKNLCGPNALSTFEEYLIDYASPATQEVGQRLIAEEMARMPDGDQQRSARLLQLVRGGERECLC